MSVLFTLLMFVPSADPDTVLVGPREFVQAMQAWVEHRTAQGHRFVHVPNTLPPEEIRKAIRQLARSGKLQTVILLGDAEPAAEVRARSVPTHLARAAVNIAWGSEPEIATDNWYADLDDDRTPDLAIGRLPADSPDELKRMARKIVDFEKRSADHSHRRVNVIAGVGGFGALVDAVLESATKTFLTDGIPSTYSLSMTYGSWRSPYCPDPRRFQNAAIDRLNEGCLFWVYVGHGHRTGLDRIQVPGRSYPILDVRDVPKVRCEGCPPIAVFLACYTGAFDHATDCLAEELLRAENGPVAAFCGSRVTMPYAMAVLGTSLMNHYFQGRETQLGRLILRAKRDLAVEAPAGSNRELLDGIAKAISPAPEKLADERREHILLFNLLGDPLLRLPQPDVLRLELPKEIEAGQPLEIAGQCDLPGRCTIELVCRRDRPRIKPVNRVSFDDSPSALDALHTTYAQANDERWTVQRLDFAGGELRTKLVVPAEARGPCHVRASVEGEKSFAVGSSDVFVRRPKTLAAE